jgi:hypothetical protein
MDWWAVKRLLQIGAIAILLLFWFIFHERTNYVARSSSGQEIKVSQSCSFPDCRTYVSIPHWWRDEIIMNIDGCGRVQFAHAMWSGGVVAAFIDAACGPMEVAYDTKRHRSVDYQMYKAVLGARIIQDYRVTPTDLQMCNNDVFEWAASYPSCAGGRSSREFLQRHPFPLF